MCEPSQEGKDIASQHGFLQTLPDVFCFLFFFSRCAFTDIAIFPYCAAVINLNYKYDAEICESLQITKCVGGVGGLGGPQIRKTTGGEGIPGQK